MPKRIIYIIVFGIAGALSALFVVLGSLAWALDAPTLVEMGERLLFALPSFATIVGGLIGLLLGKFFWPKLYNPDGSLKFSSWRDWKGKSHE